ncbi:MAG: hypothetical protein K6E30_11010 [Lachnospiraceae bacterium]|nr:hypothetical protein [Lachnospiraceae bacterium]
MYDEQSFKTSRKGFEKSEVISYLEEKDQEYADRISQLEQIIRDKDHEIEELNARVSRRNSKIDDLENEIEKKYRKYVEKYEQIGELVYDSRVRADEILAKANAEAEARLVESRKLVTDAEEEAAAKEEETKRMIAASEDEIAKNEEKSRRIIAAGQEESRRIIAHAKEEAESIVLSGRKQYAGILKDADSEARRVRNVADSDVRSALADGQGRYDEMKSEISKLADLIKMVEKRFSASCQGTLNLFAEMPDYINSEVMPVEKPAFTEPKKLAEPVMPLAEEDEDYDEDLEESAFEDSPLVSATMTFDDAFQAQLPPLPEETKEAETTRDQKMAAFESQLAKASYGEDGQFRLPGEEQAKR